MDLNSGAAASFVHFANPAPVCTFFAGFRSTCRAAAAPNPALTSPCTSALVSKAHPAWCVTPCCRRAGAKRKHSISCPTNVERPSRPSSWCTKTPSRSVNLMVLRMYLKTRNCEWWLDNLTKRNFMYLSSPTGGSKWDSPTGIQAQGPFKQGRHIFHLWESQGARYRLHPKFS